MTTATDDRHADDGLTEAARDRLRTLSPRANVLLILGDVHVLHDDGRTVRAQVDGTETTHDVRRNADGWSCTCPSWQYRHRCAHVEAVRAATAPTSDAGGLPHDAQRGACTDCGDHPRMPYPPPLHRGLCLPCATDRGTRR